MKLFLALALGLMPMQQSFSQTIQHERLDDGQIAGVLKTLNDGEITVATFALPKIRCETIRCHARHLIEDHSKGNEQILLWSEKHGIPLAFSSTAVLVADVSNLAVSHLAQIPEGKAFDRAFLDVSIESHTFALTLIDHLLIPQACNEWLIKLLHQARADVLGHLNEARALRHGIFDLEKTAEVTFDTLP